MKFINVRRKFFIIVVAIVKGDVSMTHDTKKSRLRGLFHHSQQSAKKEDTRIGFSSLKKMVTTKEQEDILKLIENETIPTVRDAWIDYLLELTKRSKCKSD